MGSQTGSAWSWQRCLVSTQVLVHVAPKGYGINGQVLGQERCCCCYRFMLWIAATMADHLKDVVLSVKENNYKSSSLWSDPWEVCGTIRCLRKYYTFRTESEHTSSYYPSSEIKLGINYVFRAIQILQTSVTDRTLTHHRNVFPRIMGK